MKGKRKEKEDGSRVQKVNRKQMIIFYFSKAEENYIFNKKEK